MKKRSLLIPVLLLCLLLCGCGTADTAKPAAVQAPPATPVIPLPTATPETAAPSAEPTPRPTTKPAETPDLPEQKQTGTDEIDVDLTQLSSTMVYSEVYAMVYEPQAYLGKTVKMKGLFTAFEGDAGKVYFNCIVQDATACCAQGLEFELSDRYVYPDDYPQPGEEITVQGTFDMYEEEHDGNSYYYLVLRNAELV